MGRDQLADQHSLDLVARFHADHGGERRLHQLRLLIKVAVLQPQSFDDLISENVGEIVVVRTADRP